MKTRIMIIGGLALLVMAVALAACGGSQPPPVCPTAAACPTCPTCPTAEPCPSCPTAVPALVQNVPFEAKWAASGHNDAEAMAFNDWNESGEVPTSCAQCHTTAGYQDFLGADGSEAGKVDAAVKAPAGTLQCETCHNEVTRQLTSVTFPYTSKDENGNDVHAQLTGLGPEARCMVCHQGRAAKSSVDAQLTRFNVTDLDAVVAPIKDDQGKDVNFGFVNIHYFAAAATLYGSEVHGGYEYADKSYDVKHDHVAGYDTCVGCHDSHSLEVKVEQCATCHEGVKTVEDLKNVRERSSLMDYDGDGNVDEGMYYEIQGLQEILYAQMQSYAKDKAGAGLVYDVATYPYFFLDADGDGKADTDDKGPVRFTAWTGRLLEAAYNYQVSLKDPGAFAHGNKYIVQLLHDSIADLGGEVSQLARDDAGHFAGNAIAFRDWDTEGEVPYRCAKCHSAGGLPEFLKNGGTVVFTSNGSTTTAGVGAMHPSNGFACTTCHDSANWPNRYAVTSVPFPSGATLGFAKDADGKFVANDSNLCIECHQGRESSNSVDAALKGKDVDTVDPKLSFKNVHYFAAGATLFGGEARGAYMYVADGKEYVGMTAHPVKECAACHDVHALEPKLATCSTCHSGATDPTTIRMSDTDYDGDGDTAEGIKGEIDTLSAALYAAMQQYASGTAGTGILYDAASYPYFFVDQDGDGKADLNDKGAPLSYQAFTPRLLKAAYNYQYVQKDPGAYVHNPQFVIQFLIDSIADLGGDVSTYTRPTVSE